MLTTTFCVGAGAKPSMVRADTASSRTSLFTGADTEPPAGISSAMPRATILSLKSTMMRWAVILPMPLMPLMRRSSPREMALHSSLTLIDDSIMRAVFGPTPLTVMSSSNISRSFFDTKPYSTWASSRIDSKTYSLAIGFWPLAVGLMPCNALYVVSEMFRP